MLLRTLASCQPGTDGLILLSLAGSLALLAACGGSSAGERASGVIVLQNENNYRSTASLSLPTVKTAPAADLDICWNEVTTDILCHAVAPKTDLDNVGFLRFLHLTEHQVEVKLVSGELRQSEVDGYTEYRTDQKATCARLSQFSFFGTPIDVAAHYVESDDETYLLVFTHGTVPGVGARVMMFVEPTAGSTNTRVDAPSGCGLLDFSADLTTLKKVGVPADGPWTVDWREVTRNGQGNELIYATIDRLLVGFYEEKTLADLEAGFFDIETLATSLWELPLTGGRTADLAQAVEHDTDAAFEGFTRTDGVWILALLCSTCQNPAPVVLTILDPGKGAP
jgi:hypothetical protein